MTGVATAIEPAMSLRAIVKEFPGVRALRSVDLTLDPGSVHALLGENGAGKSTLIRIATGAMLADSGDVQVGGRSVTRPSRRAMQQLGVRSIYQERQIARDLSVAENVLIDRLPRGRLGLINWGRAAELTTERLHVLGIDVDPRSPVDRLSVAQLQLVEIARGVSFDARVMVMDEPTASLSRHEVEPLFEVIRRLRSAGVAVLFISHHLEEVFEVADELTVMRDGQRVSTGAASEYDKSEIVAQMFGRALVGVGADSAAGAGSGTASGRQDMTAVGRTTDEPADLGDALLIAEQIDGRRLRSVSLTACAGEVVAVTGGIGAGVSELARILSGADRPTAGRVLVRRAAAMRPVRSRRHAVKLGVAFVPADRKRQGLLLDMAIAHNAMMGRQATDRHPIYTPRTISTGGTRIVNESQVRAPSASVAVRTLSGGNQQKVLIGRWLAVGSKVLIFDEPTAGIDIASKFEIYETIRRLAREGAAVVVCSTDFLEVSHVADRIVVLRSGRVVGEVAGPEADEHRLIEMEMGT